MSKTIATAAVAAVALIAFFSLRGAPAAHKVGATPVVIELFTSQGCSSCPPADELLRTIAHDASLRGRVLPLAFHVDYWDGLGWKDPFSSRAWTERQGSYVRSMRLNGSYTPQMVVGGEREMVGSNASAVWRAIEELSSRAADGVVRVNADGSIHAESPRKNVDVVLAIYDAEAVTKVERGENGGRTLIGTNIVRELRRVGTLEGRPLDVRMPVTLRANQGGVVFLQDRGTLRIGAAAVIASGRPSPGAARLSSPAQRERG